MTPSSCPSRRGFTAGLPTTTGHLARLRERHLAAQGSVYDADEDRHRHTVWARSSHETGSGGRHVKAASGLGRGETGADPSAVLSSSCAKSMSIEV
jgi:hypothetical protein